MRLIFICLVCNLYNVDIDGLQLQTWRSRVLSLSFSDHQIRIADDGLPGCTLFLKDIYALLMEQACFCTSRHAYAVAP